MDKTLEEICYEKMDDGALSKCTGLNKFRSFIECHVRASVAAIKRNQLAVMMPIQDTRALEGNMGISN